MPDVETLFYYSGARLEEEGDTLVVPVPEGLQNIGRRTISCFEYLLTHRSIDVVFRTNASSYVDLINLRNYAIQHLTPRFYSGVVAQRKIPYASGAGYFLSRDLVKRVVDAASDWHHDLTEDRALGELLARNGIHPLPAPRQQFRIKPALHQVDTSLYHFRCRTTTWRRLEDRRIMLRIHQAFCLHRGMPSVREPLGLRFWGQTFDLVRGARRRAAAIIR